MARSHLHYEVGTEPPALPTFILIKLEAKTPEEWRGILFPMEGHTLPWRRHTGRCGTAVPTDSPLLICCTRRQYPLAMAAASTIHRAQGRTITTKYSISLAARDETQWPGIIYTGLLQFRKITDFTLQQLMTVAHFANVCKKLSTTG